MRLVTVKVEVGNDHSQPIPPGLARLVEDELAARGIIGAFKLRLGPAVKGTAHTRRFCPVGVTDRNTIELYVKSKSNDSAHKAWLMPNGRILANHSDEEQPTMEGLWTAINGQPSVERRSPGAGFSEDDASVRGLLRVVATMANGTGSVSVSELKRQLSELYPHVDSRRGWGMIFGALARRKLLELEQLPNSTIVRVGITDVGRRLAHLKEQDAAPPPPAPAALPAAPTLGVDGLRRWASELSTHCERLLVACEDASGMLASAKEQLREARRQHDRLTAEFDAASRAADAAAQLVDAMEGKAKKSDEEVL